MLRTTLVLVMLTTFTPAAEAAAPRDHHLMFVTGTVGLGDCGRNLCSRSEADTGPSLGLGLGVFVRPIPYFAAGLDLHYNLVSAHDVDASRQGEAARYLLFGVELRGILPLGQVEPWVGLGAGYGYFGYFWSKDKKDEDLTVDGLALSLGLGVDVKLGDSLALGGRVRLALPDWGNRCRQKIDADKTTTECRDVDALSADERAELPDNLWYFGVTLRYAFL